MCAIFFFSLKIFFQSSEKLVGMSFPTKYLPGPGFLYSPCAHCSAQTIDKKPGINIYTYASDMSYIFFEKSSKVKFQNICGNIMAQGPAILVCFGLRTLTKRPRLSGTKIVSYATHTT